MFSLGLNVTISLHRKSRHLSLIDAHLSVNIWIPVFIKMMKRRKHSPLIYVHHTHQGTFIDLGDFSLSALENRCHQLLFVSGLAINPIIFLPPLSVTTGRLRNQFLSQHGRLSVWRLHLDEWLCRQWCTYRVNKACIICCVRTVHVVAYFNGLRQLINSY